MLAFLFDYFGAYGKLSTILSAVRILIHLEPSTLPPALIASSKRFFQAASDLLVAPDAPWTCRVCTYLNAPTASICEMCPTPSGATSARSAPINLVSV